MTINCNTSVKIIFVLFLQPFLWLYKVNQNLSTSIHEILPFTKHIIYIYNPGNKTMFVIAN